MLQSDVLVIQGRKIPYRVVRKLKIPPFAIEQCITKGYEGLIAASKKFNPAKGGKWELYAWYNVKHYIVRHMKGFQRNRIHVDGMAAEYDPSRTNYPVQDHVDFENAKDVARIYAWKTENGVPDRDWEIWCAGVTWNASSKTLAQDYELSERTVHRIRARIAALVALQKSAAAQAEQSEQSQSQPHQ